MINYYRRKKKATCQVQKQNKKKKKNTIAPHLATTNLNESTTASTTTTTTLPTLIPTLDLQPTFTFGDNNNSTSASTDKFVQSTEWKITINTLIVGLNTEICTHTQDNKETTNIQASVTPIPTLQLRPRQFLKPYKRNNYASQNQKSSAATKSY
jgi:hypothetical protein